MRNSNHLLFHVELFAPVSLPAAATGRVFPVSYIPEEDLA